MYHLRPFEHWDRGFESQSRHRCLYAFILCLCSCRGLFKRLQTLPLPCEYIFSLLNFIINNQEHFQTKSAVHSVDTRNKHHLHRPVANLTCFQKRTYYAGIKNLNNLQSSLKSLVNEKAKFKVALKRYLNTYSFYSVDEFLVSKTDSSS
jgi:hypothetical protein